MTVLRTQGHTGGRSPITDDLPSSDLGIGRDMLCEIHPLLRVSASCPRQGTCVLHVAGEVDSYTAPELSGILSPRIGTPAGVVIVDLSDVTFLGTAGLLVLVEAAIKAGHAGVALPLVVGPLCVQRALLATTLPAQLSYHNSVDDALSAAQP